MSDTGMSLVTLEEKVGATANMDTINIAGGSRMNQFMTVGGILEIEYVVTLYA